MSNKVIFFKNLVANSSYKNQDRLYYSIPVSPIKVLLTYTEDLPFNHFERAVIELLINKFYTIDELKDILLLPYDLTELIVTKMIEKQYIDEKYNVSSDVIEKLKDSSKNTTNQLCYVFYDYNRGTILNSIGDIYDYEECLSNGHSFEIENDEANIRVNYHPIKLDRSKFNTNDDIIRELIERQIVPNNDMKLKSVSIIEKDTRIYDFVGYVEPRLSKNSSRRWEVLSPVDLKSDSDLYRFFYKNNLNESIKDIISEITKSQMKLDEDEGKLYGIIRDNLFNKPISPKHEMIITPLTKVIKCLNVKAEIGNYDEFLNKNKTMSDAILNLADLFEKTLYLIAVDQPKALNFADVTKNVDSNESYLSSVAKQIGFNVSEQAKKLFRVSKQNIKFVQANPENCKINSCISWNLYLSKYNSNSFMNILAKDYPEFINLMYIFKNVYRDSARHTTNLEMESPKEYIEILFYILEKAFGYKKNEGEFKKLLNNKNTLYDYSFIHERLRSKLPELFDTNNENKTKLKVQFISMCSEIIKGDPEYISKARSIIEDILKFILNTQIKVNKIDTHSIDLIDNGNNFISIISRRGFKIESDALIGNNLVDALAIDNAAKNNLHSGFDNQFIKSNLRIKMQALILLLENKNVSSLFVKDNINLVEKLFVTISEIMYLDIKHHQNDVFDKNIANLIEENLIDTISKLINIDNLIIW